MQAPSVKWNFFYTPPHGDCYWIQRLSRQSKNNVCLGTMRQTVPRRGAEFSLP